MSGTGTSALAEIIGDRPTRPSGPPPAGDMTAILAGIALFAFGTGPVKGFAVSMLVGIITSLYTAVGVSRALATLVYGGRRKLKSIWI